MYIFNVYKNYKYTNSIRLHNLMFTLKYARLLPDNNQLAFALA